MTFQEIIDKEKAISREEALQEGIAEGVGMILASLVKDGIISAKDAEQRKAAVTLSIQEQQL